MKRWSFPSLGRGDSRAYNFFFNVIEDVCKVRSFIAELLSYIKRNPVAFNASVAPEKNLCPHCAKAHLLSWAQKEQFPAEEIRCLQKFLPGSSGHDGYYLDGEMLHKVPT